jgi:hypothetical protein
MTVMKTISSTIVATLILAFPLAGMAQNPRSLQPNEHALNLPGATAIDAPPAGFDPIHASDEELQYHGFPPRPNQTTEPKAYATWVKAINASKMRVVPQLEQTGILHGSANKQPNGNATMVEYAVTPPAPHDNNLVTTSMAGYYILSGATSYGAKSFYYIVSDFVVPIAQQWGCSGGWEYASAWDGIDGFGSPDVLQAGVEFDAFCSAAGRASYYSAWYEWYPYGEVRIGGFPVAPGDDMFVEVWHTSPTQGYVYLVNYNTNQSVELGVTAYPGRALIGNSAEWIVEDASSLVNFGWIPFWDAVAYTESSVQYCSTNGTQIVSIGPPALAPFPMGACAFVVH